MNRRLFLKLLSSVPLVGWLVPKEPKFKRLVSDIDGEIPPKFKWVLNGELIEWPGKQHEWRGDDYKNLYPDSIYVRIRSINPDWDNAKHLNLKPGGHYSWPNCVFTRENNYPRLSEAEVASFGLKPQPVPPLGTNVQIQLCRYVTSRGYYSYGYCAKVIRKNL